MTHCEFAQYWELRNSGLIREDAAEKMGYSVRALAEAQKRVMRYGLGALPGPYGRQHERNCKKYGVSRPELIAVLIGKGYNRA